MDLFNTFANAVSKLYTDQQELAAIWLSKPLNTPFGRTVRLTKDSLIRIENGLLVDFTGKASHKVLACYGTLNDQFEITVINIETNEPSQVKI